LAKTRVNLLQAAAFVVRHAVAAWPSGPRVTIISRRRHEKFISVSLT
jgi:hypothetical protein